MDSIKQVLRICDGGWVLNLNGGKTISKVPFKAIFLLQSLRYQLSKTQFGYSGDFVDQCQEAAVQPWQLLAGRYRPPCCRVYTQHGDDCGEIMS